MRARRDTCDTATAPACRRARRERCRCARVICVRDRRRTIRHDSRGRSAGGRRKAHRGHVAVDRRARPAPRSTPKRSPSPARPPVLRRRRKSIASMPAASGCRSRTSRRTARAPPAGRHRQVVTDGLARLAGVGMSCRDRAATPCAALTASNRAMATVRLVVLHPALGNSPAVEQPIRTEFGRLAASSASASRRPPWALPPNMTGKRWASRCGRPGRRPAGASEAISQLTYCFLSFVGAAPRRRDSAKSSRHSNIRGRGPDATERQRPCVGTG